MFAKYKNRMKTFRKESHQQDGQIPTTGFKVDKFLNTPCPFMPFLGTTLVVLIMLAISNVHHQGELLWCVIQGAIYISVG